MLRFFIYNESQNTRWNLLLHAPNANIRKWKSFPSIGAYFFMSVKTARLFFALSPAIAASFVHLVRYPVRPPRIHRKSALSAAVRLAPRLWRSRSFWGSGPGFRGEIESQFRLQEPGYLLRR
jgi:hypothetical protein